MHLFFNLLDSLVFLFYNAADTELVIYSHQSRISLFLLCGGKAGMHSAQQMALESVNCMVC
jgi:hypothetical protein